MVAFSTSTSVSTIGATTYTDITLIFDFSGDKLCDGMAMRNHLYAKYPVNQTDDIQGNDIESVLFEYKQKNTLSGLIPQGQKLLSLLSLPVSPPLAYDHTYINEIDGDATAYSYSIDTTTGDISTSRSMTRIYYRTIGAAIMVTDGMMPYFCVALPSLFKAVFSSIGHSEPSHAVFDLIGSSTIPLPFYARLFQLVDYNDAPYAPHLVYSSTNDGKLISNNLPYDRPEIVTYSAEIVTNSAKDFFALASHGFDFYQGGVSVSRTPSVSWDSVVIYDNPSLTPGGTVECNWYDLLGLVHTDTSPITWAGPSTVSIGGGSSTYYVYTSTGSTSFTNFSGSVMVSIGVMINNNGWIYENGKYVSNVRRAFSIVPASGPDGSWIPAIFYKI